MAAILPFVRDKNVFEPKDIDAMSTALEEISERLELRDDSSARASMADQRVAVLAADFAVLVAVTGVDCHSALRLCLLFK